MYKNFPDNYSVTYELHNGDLIYIDGCKNYRYLMHLEDSDCGCPVKNIPTLTHLCVGLTRLLGREGTYNAITEINHTFWTCEITVSENHLVSNGTRAINLQCLNGTNSNISISDYINKDSLYLTTVYDGHYHRIASFSESAKLLPISVGDKIDALYSFYGNQIKSTNLYDDCIRNKKQVSFIELFHMSDKVVRCSCALIPLSYMPDIKVLTILNPLNVSQYMQLHKINMSYLNDWYSVSHAAAWYDIPSDSFVSYNDIFHDIVHKLGNSARKMITSCPGFKAAIVNRNLSISRLNAKDIYGNIQEYDCYFIPIIGKNGLLIILFETKATSQLLNTLQQELTNREYDVLVLVLKGYSSEKIAALLDISNGTVTKILYYIYRKFGVSSKSELFAYLF